MGLISPGNTCITWVVAAQGKKIGERQLNRLNHQGRRTLRCVPQRRSLTKEGSRGEKTLRPCDAQRREGRYSEQ